MAKKASKYANAVAAVKISSTSKKQDRAAAARGGTKPVSGYAKDVPAAKRLVAGMKSKAKKK